MEPPTQPHSSGHVMVVVMVIRETDTGGEGRGLLCVWKGVKIVLQTRSEKEERTRAFCGLQEKERAACDERMHRKERALNC